MRRINSRGAAIAALAATTLLGACTDMYLDRRDTMSFEAGDAVAVNKAIQVVDPWPARAGDRDISYNGERMQAAAERYRTGKVTPLAGTSTSSLQYQQQTAAPPATK